MTFRIGTPRAPALHVCESESESDVRTRVPCLAAYCSWAHAHDGNQYLTVEKQQTHPPQSTLLVLSCLVPPEVQVHVSKRQTWQQVLLQFLPCASILNTSAWSHCRACPWCVYFHANLQWLVHLKHCQGEA